MHVEKSESANSKVAYWDKEPANLKSVFTRPIKPNLMPGCRLPDSCYSDWPRATLLTNDNYCVPKGNPIDTAGRVLLASGQTLNVETLIQLSRR